MASKGQPVNLDLPPSGEPREGRIASVNISREVGTIKTPVERAELTRTGLVGDAHAGTWHRQVSLLGTDSIARFAATAGREIAPGEFAENLTVDGLDFRTVAILDRFRIRASDAEAAEDDVFVEFEVTQIGKECHGDACAIFREVGSCVMPHEGLFARVTEEGEVRPGDWVEYLPTTLPVWCITLSDRAAAGEYEDKSGPKLAEMARECLALRRYRTKVERRVIPDDATTLRTTIQESLEAGPGILFTTGGTGIGPRDVTPDVVAGMIDKEIPGIMDAIRIKYGLEKPGALISRSIAGVIDQSLIFCLPGSVRAVEEYMTEINKVLEHLLLMLRGIDRHG